MREQIRRICSLNFRLSLCICFRSVIQHKDGFVAFLYSESFGYVFDQCCPVALN